MFTANGEYYEAGWCAYCGLPCDREGDCVNPLCNSKDADIAALSEEDLTILDDLSDLDDNEPTRPK